MAKKKVHRFGEVCRLLDVQPYVLRYWETEFAALASEDADSGQRTYTDKDLAVVQRIKELLYNESFTLVGAKKKLQAELDEGTLKLSGAVGEEPDAEEEPAVEPVDEPDEEEIAAAPEDDEEEDEEPPPTAKTKKKTVARKKAAAKAASAAASDPVEAGPTVDLAELKAILTDAEKLLKELQA